MTERWRLTRSGPLEPLEIHAIYEAIAYGVSNNEAPDTLHVCWPSRPYVCIGIHQIAELEVDMDKCREMGLQVVRRQLGGGAVYLDSNQFFYHIVVHKKHAPVNIREMFQRYLQPTICTYRKFGLPAEYRPLNDVVIRGRKASGNGAATFSDAVVVVGNVILDFEPKAFASVLRIPDEKMRDKMIRSMEEWVTSLRKELGRKPSMSEVEEAYRRCFEEIYGIELVEGELTPSEREYMKKLMKKYGDKKWIFKYREKHGGMLSRVGGKRKVKVMENHYILQLVEKPEKLIRVVVEVRDNKILDIAISGDFFLNPPELLDEIENSLVERSVDTIENLRPEDVISSQDPRSLSEDMKSLISQILDIVAKVKSELR